MAAHYQAKTFRKGHHDLPSSYQAHFKELEKDFIEKLTIAQNIFHRIKHYTSELEILIAGVIKVYCGSTFTEKNRIDHLLKNIQNEISEFDERIDMSHMIEQYDLYPEDLKPSKQASLLFNESLLSSTRSDQNAMLAIKNEVKDLISDYKDAVGKLKEENATIQQLVAERKHQREPEEHSRGYNYNKENMSSNVVRSPKYVEKDESFEESQTQSEYKKKEEKKNAKYLELNKFIDDLNKKKEENMRKLTTIETRLATIRKTTTDEDQGYLKASDLSREEERTPAFMSGKNRNVNMESARKLKKIEKEQVDDHRDYANYMRQIAEIARKKKSVKVDEEARYERVGPRSRGKKSNNESSVLEEEIDELNKEISTIKNLLDSAIIQKKYQNKI